jgi:hypothetical protein
MIWILTALASLGAYWFVLGGVTVLWALWTLLRLPFDLRHRRPGRD